MGGRVYYVGGAVRDRLMGVECKDIDVEVYGIAPGQLREVLARHPHAHFIDDIHPLARMMAPLAEKAMRQERWEDVAYFEPFYLKEFVAGKPKPLI